MDLKALIGDENHIAVAGHDLRLGNIAPYSNPSLTSGYARSLGDGAITSALPAEAREATEESVVAAGFVAQELGPASDAFLAEVADAFLAGLAVACWTASGVALAGALFALRYLPARAPSAEMATTAGAS